MLQINIIANVQEVLQVTLEFTECPSFNLVSNNTYSHNNNRWDDNYNSNGIILYN